MNWTIRKRRRVKKRETPEWFIIIITADVNQEKTFHLWFSFDSVEVLPFQFKENHPIFHLLTCISSLLLLLFIKPGGGKHSQRFSLLNG